MICTISKSDLETAQSGHSQSSGIALQGVPGGMPSSGKPLDSSYINPHIMHCQTFMGSSQSAIGDTDCELRLVPQNIHVSTNREPLKTVASSKLSPAPPLSELLANQSPTAVPAIRANTMPNQ